ncbi:tetratricopeptide repeat protein [Tundrisphaera lichenicola]|uniref:tetratricopeptide repeat protein n=1 Tax=Tundrisphaera lichenicola TaxID=2029860 RepID=UPI003EC0615D
MSLDPKRVQAVFGATVEYDAASDRAGVLDRECSTDLELRRRVEALLMAYDRPESLLERPFLAPGDPAATTCFRPADRPDSPTIAYDPASDGGPVSGLAVEGLAPRPLAEGPGSRIGPYKLLQMIGEGGMGSVYMAEQEQPVRRRVALKIIKPGMDSAQVIARFEAERQALALMDHQCIARVLDAGATDTGRPYFVMELVHGVPITQYCDEAKLAPTGRLELFIHVCQAIQHAHQKGIIHRDIKPSNVLVTLYDGKPVPKVIDFGIAKATDQRLTERTMFTEFGSIVGTLEYMSPEQAEMSAMGVDTRSDIYSLGVMLYELMTGSTPLERARLHKAGYVEILRRIKEEETPRPSTRLITSGGTTAQISDQRRTEAMKLSRAMRGELDWIVMKALEKDRNRRYETAGAFARDIRNYLAGDPVEACPPSTSYRLQKFARKHRPALIVASAFTSLLILGAVLSTWQAIRATRAEALSNIESEKARRSAAESEAVLKFFQDQVLAAARPEGQEGGLGKDVTIRRAIDAAEPKIASAFEDQGAVEAAIRGVLGTTYHFLGEPSLAIRQLTRTLELRKGVLGPDHPDTLTAQNQLALAYRDDGQWDRAIPLFERTLTAEAATLGPDHPNTLLTQNNLALTYRDDGQWDRAIPLFERTLAARAAQLGADHPDTLLTQHNLAMAHREAGHWDRAIPLFEQTLTSQVAKLGADHPYTLLTQSNLGPAYQAVGQTDRAIELLERALAGRSAKLGADHPSTLSTQKNLALSFQADGQLDRAIALLERTLATLTAKLGVDHTRTLAARFDLALAYEASGDPTRAEPMLREVLAARRKKLGANHPDVAQTLSALGRNLLDQKRWDEAEPYLREGLAAWEAKRPDDWNRFDTQSLLGESLLGRQKYAEAEPLLLNGYEGLKSREARIPADLRMLSTRAAERVVQLYQSTDREAKAAEWRAKR